MLVKPYKQYVCGAFFYVRGGERGGINKIIATLKFLKNVNFIFYNIS